MGEEEGGGALMAVAADGKHGRGWARDYRFGRRIGAVGLAIAGVFALDALTFRGERYTSILEPDSSSGTFELILRREKAAQARYGANLIVTLGDSRFAYYPRVANQQSAQTGFSFRNAGVAGTNAREWYYMLRDVDTTRRR